MLKFRIGIAKIGNMKFVRCAWLRSGAREEEEGSMRRQGAHSHDSDDDQASLSIASSIPDGEEDHKYHHSYPAGSSSSGSPPFINLIIFLATVTASAISYYSTLEGGDTEQWLHARLYGMAMWMVISDVLFMLAIMVALSMEGKWRRGAIFYAVTSILCMFALDQGNTVQHHGAYVLPPLLSFSDNFPPLQIISLYSLILLFVVTCTPPLLLLSLSVLHILLFCLSTRTIAPLTN